MFPLANDVHGAGICDRTTRVSADFEACALMPARVPHASPTLFPEGVVCDRFRIDGVLGIGGTGTVFRGLDLETQRPVAVKAIPHEATLRQRARREVAVAGRLNHPHIVQLRGVVEDEHYVYVISDLVDGGDLASGLKSEELGDAGRLRICAAVCEALAHAHEHGIVHRDVKPANVLLGRDGSVRLADFGIAAVAEPDATVDDRMLGTLSYMAPETCRGARPAAAADVWSAGVLAYEALSGANPFRSRTPDELRERHGAIRPLAEVRPDLHAGLTTAIARALHPQPARRPSAEHLARALQAAADRIERPAPLERTPPRRSPPRLAVPRALPSAGSLLVGLTQAIEGVAGLGFAAPLGAGSRRLATAATNAALVGIAVASVLVAFPFWPPGATIPLAVACGLLATVAPWCAGVLALALVIPALGDVSAGLAWSLGIALLAWCATGLRAGRRTLWPIAAPLLQAVWLWPLYPLVAGTLRTPAGRALAGAAGPLALALWHAGPSAAASLGGTGAVGPVAHDLLRGAVATAPQAIVWALAAALWPKALEAANRGLAIALWLGGLLAGEALTNSAFVPGPGVGAIWLVAILVALAVRARVGGAPEGTPAGVDGQD